MPQNGIRMAGIEALAKGLAQSPHLETLDLQDNTATETGTRAIAVALPTWPSLRVLNLSDCLLSPKGGIALATALNKGRNTNIETLRLQYGEFDRHTINLIAQAVSDHLPNLTRLEINGNRADPEDECITNLRDALQKHNHEDALDELDDMEGVEEEEEEESPAVQEAEEIDKVEAKEETKLPPVATTVDPTDELAGLMGKVHIDEA